LPPLSPCYRRDSLALHFTWVPDQDAVLPVLAALQDVLAPLAPRPHWGKLFTIDPQTLAARYPRHADFTRLLPDFDPKGKFRDEFVERYFPVES
jgi:xylitol oxidase